MTKKIVKRTDANNETLYFYTHSDAVDVGDGSSTKSLTEVIGDTLHKSAQTLTNAEKTQVYANLGLNGVDDVPTENSNNIVRSGGVKAAIDDVIDDFTNRGFMYKGIAPVSAPLGEDKTFYIAKSGDYTAYTGIGDGSFTLNGIAVLTYATATTSGAWTKNDIVLFDDEPTAGSDNLVKSGGVSKAVKSIVNSNNTEDFDLGFCDDEGNVVAKFENGHIKTKHFDSSVNAITTEEKEKISTVEAGAEVNDVNSNNTSQADLEFSDEDGNVLMQLLNGDVKTKNFDSSKIKNANNISYPVFKAYKSPDDTHSSIPSEDYKKYLYTNMIDVAAGDTVNIKDISKIDKIKVLGYNTQVGVTSDSGWINTEYTVPANTNLIKIIGKPSETDPLYIDNVIYGNSAFMYNVFVTHNGTVKDKTLFVGSTIPSGWYVAQHSEFSVNHDDNNPFDGEGNSALTLKQIYDKLQELASNYSDYFKLEQIGWDSSYGKVPKDTLHDNDFSDWMDGNRLLSIPVYRYILEPKATSFSSQIGVSKINGKDDIPTIYMQFGTHADERPCMRAMMNFFIHICRDWRNDAFLEYLRWNVRIVGIPVVVPYSYVVGSRSNYNGININRNYYNGGMWDSFVDDPPMNAKGDSALSEVETRNSYRNLLEFADSIVAFDWHTHGAQSSWRTITTFAIPYRVDKSGITSLIGIDLSKGLTLSGIKNHKLPDPLINPDESVPSYPYISYMEPSTQPSFTSVMIDVPSVLSATPEAIYKYYDGQGGVTYNNFIDCMNEEFVVNSVLCSIRQTILNNK